MRYKLNVILVGACLIAISSGWRQATLAADVRVGLSSRETYVDYPVTLEIEISNASDHEPPVIPEVDGIRTRPTGTPSRRTQITSINGRTTKSTTLTYTFELTPQREGTFTIPPITVMADGKKERTEPIRLAATASETGDLLFVEVTGNQQQIFVGQALELTLRIWIRPFRDREHDVTLSEADMWRLISDRTSWGAFDERIQELASANQRPGGTEVLREDDDGNSRSYYLYEIDATVYPQRPGEIDADDVRIVVQYPTALGKSRDTFARLLDDFPMRMPRSSFFDDDDFFLSFGSPLRVESMRPIIAEATVEPIDVLPIPRAGQPDDYRGAVGRYQIITEAKPTSVKAGDPINLLIGVTGTGPMELVQAPPLAELSSLTADFKVPNEPLASFVEEGRKYFSTTIRPRREGVAEIPSIPLSYFDPDAKEFGTAWSEPIPIQVDEAETLTLDAIVGEPAGGQSDNAQPTDHEHAGAPSLENFAGDDLLADESPLRLTRWQWRGLLAGPPLLALAMIVARYRYMAGSVISRCRSTVRRCRSDIESADHPAEIATALQTLLGRRYGIRNEMQNTLAAVGALRAAGHRDLAIRCERIFSQCDRSENSRSLVGGPSLNELKSEALHLIEDLQQSRRARPKPTKPPKGVAAHLRTGQLDLSAAIVIMTLTVAAWLMACHAVFAAAEGDMSSTISPQKASRANRSLSREARLVLLQEAYERYHLAAGAQEEDSADAKQAFSEAAEKYQLVVDAGVVNSRLYFNLANAYLQSGQRGRAIANYRRALRLDPTDRQVRANLNYAERMAEPSDAADETASSSDTIGEYAALINNWINHYVHPRTVFVIAMFAWLTHWVAIGLRGVGVYFPWRSTAASALIVAVVMGGSYWLSCQQSQARLAVIVSPTVTLHEGDGRTFPSITVLEPAEGHTMEVVRQRGDWVQVRTARGHSGWLPIEAVELIERRS